jgi:hypothetical protein
MKKLVPSEKSQFEKEGCDDAIEQHLGHMFIFQNRKDLNRYIIINIFCFKRNSWFFFV